MTLRVYIGHDSRELRAARVAAKTLHETSRLEAEFLHINRLREPGLLNRPADRRGAGYVQYDLISNAKASTDFAFSRFLVPILCQGGYALFTDCDMLFMRDVRAMLKGIDTTKAVHVVKHAYEAVETTRRDGQPQTNYPRKNWSSFMLFNNAHSVVKALTPLPAGITSGTSWPISLCHSSQ